MLCCARIGVVPLEKVPGALPVFSEVADVDDLVMQLLMQTPWWCVVAIPIWLVRRTSHVTLYVNLVWYPSVAMCFS